MRILIVEDEKKMAAVLKKGLEADNHRVILAYDGRTGLELASTARDAVPDIVKGLDLGADDYVTKPFPFDVFLARLRSVARRGSAPRPTSLQVGDLILNPASRQVRRGNREIHLSPTEFRLLELLMRRSGKVIPRDVIVEAVWDFDQEIEENTLDTFIRLLRSKVDRDHDHKLIHTVRGIGYTLREGSGT
jgi:DNA-binding response OmpR family regulator